MGDPGSGCRSEECWSLQAVLQTKFFEYRVPERQRRQRRGWGGKHGTEWAAIDVATKCFIVVQWYILLEKLKFKC